MWNAAKIVLRGQLSLGVYIRNRKRSPINNKNSSIKKFFFKGGRNKQKETKEGKSKDKCRNQGYAK